MGRTTAGDESCDFAERYGFHARVTGDRGIPSNVVVLGSGRELEPRLHQRLWPRGLSEWAGVPYEWLLGEVTHHLRVGMIFRTGPFQQMEKFSP
jgi:hypothetical protein